MTRMRSSLIAAATLLALAAPATAGAAGALDTYQRLVERHLHPAPLVPVGVPPSLVPLERTCPPRVGVRPAMAFASCITRRTVQTPWTRGRHTVMTTFPRAWWPSMWATAAAADSSA
jgi:hypothetical protein